MSSSFVSWLDTFVDEKELDRDHIFEVEGPSGLNLIPLNNVLAALRQASGSEQEQVRRKLVALDFANADAMKFFEHLAHALVI